MILGASRRCCVVANGCTKKKAIIQKNQNTKGSAIDRKYILIWRECLLVVYPTCCFFDPIGAQWSLDTTTSRREENDGRNALCSRKVHGGRYQETGLESAVSSDNGFRTDPELRHMAHSVVAMRLDQMAQILKKIAGLLEQSTVLLR